MTPDERAHLTNLLERIKNRHDHKRLGDERLIREIYTYEDIRDALEIIRRDT